uniref:Protein kinase domain-containing protein n=1 Tax=Hordeum vulgare subsp. vulgare TaxID=112509 RepID=A0A8I7BAC6_HORVV
MCHSDQERGRNYTMDDPDLVFLVDKDSGFAKMDLYNLSNAAMNNTVLSTMDRLIQLSQRRPDGLGVDEASFSVAIVVRNQTLPAVSNHLAFLILPAEALDFLQVNDSLPLAKELVIDTSFYYQDNRTSFANTTYRSGSVSGINMYVDMTIGMLASPTQTGYLGERVLVVNILTSIVGSNYSVWIDYDGAGLLSVYADGEGRPKPTNSIGQAPFSTGRVVSPTSMFAYFGFLSVVEPRLRSRGIHFTATVDSFPCYPVNRGFLSRKVTILSSVLGSIAATAVVAATMACYFNSRYRRWHKDLDQLARSMEHLPGVPTKIDFTDIRKATNNFHDSMKLGRGGFGTVYRCTLPAAASKLELPMDVAIKRFTRDLQNRRYDDFLTEVSIINRLRHKNIVPLIGWSYDKGVPLLVFTTGLHYVHHEYEPMVLHRDIKASNIMLDSRFQAHLGDFGLACTVAIDRNSVTGVGGTWGYIAPEYPVCRKATRQTDIYALGVLILEVVTGLRALADHEVVDDDDMHITDRVWRLHREGRLLDCMDAMLIDSFAPENEDQLDIVGDAERLLLLGLACSNPNPSDRPTMPDVVRVIAKSAPPPQVSPLKPRFVWPPQEEGRSLASNDYSVDTLVISNLDKSMASLTRGHASFQLQHFVALTTSSDSHL